MRTLNKQQLLDICYGAGFLGSGGGGAVKTALQLVKKLPSGVTVKVNAESYCRPILEGFDQEAGLATWVMDKPSLQQVVTIRGTLQLAEDAGYILRTSKHPIDDVLKLLENCGLTARRLFTGIVQPPESETSRTV